MVVVELEWRTRGVRRGEGLDTQKSTKSLDDDEKSGGGRLYLHGLECAIASCDGYVAI